MINSILLFSLLFLTNPERAKFSPELISGLERGEGFHSVLVQMTDQADLAPAREIGKREDRIRYVYDALRNVALKSQQDIVKFLEAEGVKHKRFYISNMIWIKNPPSGLFRKLAARSDVKRILTNPTYPIRLPVTEPSREIQRAGVGDNIKVTKAQIAWMDFATRGENIVVAGQDTGVDWGHPALKKKYRGYNAETDSVDHNYSWHDAIHESLGSGSNPCGYSSATPCDDDQHGTHTMGTIVGDDDQGNQIGMAPGAKWIACRNMDKGVGTPATYIECFEYFLAPYPHGGNAMTDGDPSKAPHVINNSWGCPNSEGCVTGEEILATLKAMREAGIMVVASAGNEGSGCSTIANAPAHHSFDTLSVGALDHRSKKIAYFSSRGPSRFDNEVGPDVSAPGVNVRSAIPGGGYAGSGWSGTSMAGPHVAGLVALIWSAAPSFVGKVDDTAGIIRGTAEALTTSESCGGVAGSAIPNNTYGYGLIDAHAAIAAARSALK